MPKAIFWSTSGFYDMITTFLCFSIIKLFDNVLGVTTRESPTPVGLPVDILLDSYNS